MTILRAYVVKIFNGIFQALENESIDSFDKKTLDERANDCSHVANEAYIAAIIIGVIRLFSSLLLSKLLYHFKRRNLYFISGKSWTS